MAIHITAYQSRDTTETITLRNAAGESITLAGDDKIRIKIGRSGKTPLLDILGGTALNGTTLTNVNPATLSLYAASLAPSIIKPGVYDLEALVLDTADNNRLKHAESGVFVLIGTQLGQVGAS
jgi:hypothetical protein